MQNYFTVHRRNPNHWDVCDINGRTHTIRGEPGSITLHEDRRHAPDSLIFKTPQAAVAYLADQFMTEDA